MFSGEQLLSLIKKSPLSSDKKHDSGGRSEPDHRGRTVPSSLAGSRELRGKARPASELEAEWRREVDAKKAAEDESRRLEEEKRQQVEDKAEQERLKQVQIYMF